mgnify:CR=1 FL=1|tara:strand:+ start:356 stop:709 length:354 start_codon:yes stop_codon:yes gene_type:complete
MTKETKVIVHNPENPNSGYTIENPYETKVRFRTPKLNKEGFIDIPKITVIGLINFLYVGEGTERDGRLGFRSRAVSELNYWFGTKKTYRFWRKALRPMYEEMGVHKAQREVVEDMDI